MKLYLLILLMGSVYTGELEVDGDLTVTGTIQSHTIDSLLQVIADLQSQITALQSAGGFETRIYQLPTYTAIPYNSEEVVKS